MLANNVFYQYTKELKLECFMKIKLFQECTQLSNLGVIQQKFNLLDHGPYPGETLTLLSSKPNKTNTTDFKKSNSVNKNQNKTNKQTS